MMHFIRSPCRSPRRKRVKATRQIAEELRAEVDKARAHSRRGQSVAIPFASPRGSLEGLLELRSPRFNLNDVVLNERLLSRIEDVLRQQRKRD